MHVPPALCFGPLPTCLRDLPLHHHAASLPAGALAAPRPTAPNWQHQRRRQRKHQSCTPSLAPSPAKEKAAGCSCKEGSQPAGKLDILQAAATVWLKWRQVNWQQLPCPSSYTCCSCRNRHSSTAHAWSLYSPGLSPRFLAHVCRRSVNMHIESYRSGSAPTSSAAI